VYVCRVPNDIVKKFILLRDKNNLSSIGMDRPPNHKNAARSSFLVLVLLASFCVWTKSLVCIDAVLTGIPLFKVMLEDSALLSRQKFSIPCQPVRTPI